MPDPAGTGSGTFRILIVFRYVFRYVFLHRSGTSLSKKKHIKYTLSMAIWAFGFPVLPEESHQGPVLRIKIWR